MRRPWRSRRSTTTPAPSSRAFALAFTHAQSGLRHLGVSREEARLFERLASRVLFTDGSLRASPETLASNELGQASLWPHGISGDLPILLVRVVADDDLLLVRQVLQAQEYWRLKGLIADVVILNEHPVGYLDEMQAQLAALLDSGPWSAWKHRPGGAYLLRGDRMGGAERTLLEAVARAVLSGDRGDLRAQLDRPHPVRAIAAPDVLAAAPSDAGLAPTPPGTRLSVPALTLANGLGGFADEGREYVITPDGDENTPLPWANVIANPSFGTIVTASGSAHTWSDNSRENRLTPFANDPVSDPTAEALFVRDDDSGEAWSPTPGPMSRGPLSGRFIVRHGAGVSRFSRASHGISHELDVFVDAADPVKFSAPQPDERRRRAAHAERLRLQRLGARTAEGRRAPARRHRARREDGRRPRPERVQPGVRAPRGVRVRERDAVFRDGGPSVVHRTQRLARAAGGARPRGALRAVRGRTRPVRGAPRPDRPEPRREPSRRVSAGPGRRCATTPAR